MFSLFLGFRAFQELLFSTTYWFVKSGTFRVLNNTGVPKCSSAVTSPNWNFHGAKKYPSWNVLVTKCPRSKKSPWWNGFPMKCPCHNVSCQNARCWNKSKPTKLLLQTWNQPLFCFSDVASKQSQGHPSHTMHSVMPHCIFCKHAKKKDFPFFCSYASMTIKITIFHNPLMF